jgi:hypothetical protein
MFPLLSLQYELLLHLLEAAISFLSFQKINQLPDEMLIMFSIYSFTPASFLDRRRDRHRTHFGLSGEDKKPIIPDGNQTLAVISTPPLY